MSASEENILIRILDAIDNYIRAGSNTSYESALKAAQIAKDLSQTYLNITQASKLKGEDDKQ